MPPPLLQFLAPTGSGALLIGFRTPGLSAELSLEAKIEFAAELGVPVIETMITPREFESVEAARRMYRAACEHGVRITSSGANIPLTEPDAETAAPGAVAEAIAYARALKIDYVFSRAMPPASEAGSQTWRRLAKVGTRIAAQFAEAGIRWGLEPDKGTWVHTLERLEQALDAINHENCYPNFDPTNLYLGGSDPLRAIKSLGPRMHNVHLKDGVYRMDGSHETPFGLGEMDHSGILTALLSLGRPLHAHLEHCKSTAEVRDGINRIAALLRPLARRG